MNIITIALIEKAKCPLDDKFIGGIKAEVDKEKVEECLNKLEKVLNKYALKGE